MTSQPLDTRGFSLVEVLVSISILLLVMTGPMSLLTRANNSTVFASQQVNAWFLAQEGLELVEKQRDDLLLQYFNGAIPNPWVKFSTASGAWTSCFNATYGCGLIIATNVIPPPVNCQVVGNCRLYIDSGSTRASYIHGGIAGSETPYTRVIRIDNSQSGPKNEIKVTSTVTWRTGSLIAGQKVEAITYLYNIYATP